MFDEVLKKEYKFLTEYFETAIKNNSLSHSIQFCGSNILGQYYFALNIAKLLNCLKNKEKDCDCLNCRWVTENKHPAVITVSPIDFKSDTSQIISIEQMRNIKEMLGTSSDYHRVFIFCGAKNTILSERETYFKNKYKDVKYSLINEKWFPENINSYIFPSPTANAILKIIEEPPSNVTFFFLTQNKTDLIETIVSRSQVFNVNSFVEETFSLDFAKKIFENYPNLSKFNYLTQEVINHSNETSLSFEQILSSFQYYLKKILEINIKNKLFRNKIYTDIRLIEKAKTKIKNTVSAISALEDMFLGIIQGE